ncbi:hypothetical protein J6590_066134 [Homalodisca vitripennis]|nr:hypothetical protein J6590_066134 [Homalodisca vitripennis]
MMRQDEVMKNMTTTRKEEQIRKLFHETTENGFDSFNPRKITSKGFLQRKNPKRIEDSNVPRLRGGFEDLPPLGYPQFAALLSPSPHQPCRLTLVPRWVK